MSCKLQDLPMGIPVINFQSLNFRVSARKERLTAFVQRYMICFLILGKQK